MRLIIFLLTISLFISCKKEETKAPLYPKVAQTPEQLGKEIFAGKGNCVACHQPEQKIVGPSILEIAQIYKDKNASIVAFLKEKSGPLVNPDQYEVMKTNFAITKSMSDEELKAVEAYMYSNLK
jgi:cytochrome c